MWPTRLEYSWPFDWYSNDFSKDDRLVKMNLLLCFCCGKSFVDFFAILNCYATRKCFRRLSLAGGREKIGKLPFEEIRGDCLGFCQPFFILFVKPLHKITPVEDLIKIKNFIFILFFFSQFFSDFFLSAFSYLLYFIMIVSSIEMVVIY